MTSRVRSNAARRSQGPCHCRACDEVNSRAVDGSLAASGISRGALVTAIPAGASRDRVLAVTACGDELMNRSRLRCTTPSGRMKLSRWTRCGRSRRQLTVSFLPLTDPERSVDVELPVHALLLWPEVAGRIRHRDHLRPVDLVRVPIGHDGRRALAKNILQPVSALAVRQSDQEAVIMPGRDDGCLVCTARSPADMADDRGVGSFLAG